MYVCMYVCMYVYCGFDDTYHVFFCMTAYMHDCHVQRHTRKEYKIQTGIYLQKCSCIHHGQVV